MADITTASITPIAAAVKADIAAEESKVKAFLTKIAPYAIAVGAGAVGGHFVPAILKAIF